MDELTASLHNVELNRSDAEALNKRLRSELEDVRAELEKAYASSLLDASIATHRSQLPDYSSF